MFYVIFLSMAFIYPSMYLSLRANDKKRRRVKINRYYVFLPDSLNGEKFKSVSQKKNNYSFNLPALRGITTRSAERIDRG